MTKPLRAPFPWFGGKSRAAHLVWAAFGDVPNFVEPFAGSLAVLLGRPTPARIETVNDLDCWIANFWRAVTAAPDLVAHHADWPVNEADLHAWHRWLMGIGSAKCRGQHRIFVERMKRDPFYFDARRAGKWLWGICQWIGSGWCSQPENSSRPHLKTAGSGVHRVPRGRNTAEHEQRPSLSQDTGIRSRNISNAANWNKRPVLAHSNRGVHFVSEQKPLLRGDGGAAGAGIHASGLADKMPKMDRGTDSRMVGPREAIFAWMFALQDRLRRVRVCCGDWKRVTGRSATECIGVTGIFYDPPYGVDAKRDPSLYAHDSLDVAAEVREWCLANGDNPKLRIALCGYEGEHEMPSSWQCVPWKANGGYASSAGNHENAHRERIWFSPACLPVLERQPSLFKAEVAG